MILGVAMVTAGVVYPVTGAALHHTTPITIAAVRAIGGGILLTLALPLLGSRLPRTRRLWVIAALIGFGNTTLTLLGISEGTSRAGPAVASVLLNTSPFFVAVLGRVVLAERINRLRLTGLVIGFAGVLAVVVSDPGDVASGSALVTGFVFALVGALGWAAAGLAMRAVSMRDRLLDVAGLTAAQFLCGSVPLVPAAAVRGRLDAVGRAVPAGRAGVPRPRRPGARLPRLQRRARALAVDPVTPGRSWCRPWRW